MAEQSDAPEGVAFPELGESRSTTATGREALAIAAFAVDEELGRSIRTTKDWRKQYIGPARDLVIAAGRSTEGAVAMSADGLDYLQDSFVFIRNGRDHPLREATSLPVRAPISTSTFVGGGERVTRVSVPYKGRDLEGSDLRMQVGRWVADGVAEPSLVGAVGAAIDHPEWFDLSDRTFIVLGAGAELSPTRQLLEWGARVVPLDLRRPDVWKRLLETVTDTSGALLVPVPEGISSDAEEVAAVAGVDLLADLPEIAAWLREFEGPLVLGNYLYADGAANVRLSMAADALGLDLVDTRGIDEVTLAFLATPTDAFEVDADVVADSHRRWDHRPMVAKATRFPLRPVNLFQPNYPVTYAADDGSRYGIADCLVPQQGPNYLLAKRMQRWRAIVSRGDGLRVSLNVAPATRTRSVVKNKLLAAAYAGAGRFGMEIFEPATTNALMALLLVRDLNDPTSCADPSVELSHPSAIFSEAAVHGGLWRSAYSPRSVLSVAAVVGMMERAA